jgi:hypothetical protein
MSAVREWALANGYTVGTRGRIPDTVLTAYQAAHPELEPEAEPEREWAVTVDLPGVSPEAEARICELMFDLVMEAYRAGIEAAS